MDSAQYMPLGRPGGPYRPEGRLTGTRVVCVGSGLLLLLWYYLSSAPTPVPADKAAQERMAAASAAALRRVVHAIEDRGEGDDEVLRDNPQALFALRQALRQAVAEANEAGEGADPLEILAHKLLQRSGKLVRQAGGEAGEDERVRASVGGGIASNANLVAMSEELSAREDGKSAGGTSRPPLLAERLKALKAGKGGGPDVSPRSAPIRGGMGTSQPNGGLPLKLPTAAMWPPRFTRGGSVRSPYESLGSLEPYRGGDLEMPGELKRAAAARSFNGEIILTYGNEAGTAWIANLVFSLRAVGIEHFLVIVSR